jgi:quinol monooxygenase YgiN
MPVTRINHFAAKETLEERLDAFLKSVVKIVQSCPGCISVRLLRSTEDPVRFAIVEEWESVEAHQKAASTITPSQIEEAKTLVAGPPTGMYYRSA